MKPPPIKLAGALILFLLFALIFFNRKSLFQLEPMHKGKPLTAWVDQWQSNRWTRHPTFQNDHACAEAQQAILSMQPDAIPYLLYLMQSEKPTWKEKLRRKLPHEWQVRLRLFDNRDRMTGATGLVALGTNAAPAIPALMQMLRANPGSGPLNSHLGALSSWTLMQLAPVSEPAVPLLMENLTNSTVAASVFAAHALGNLRMRPETVVPALIAFLQSPQSQSDGSARRAGIEALHLYGIHATSAAPSVRPFLHDRDPDVRRSAFHFLTYIDRITLGNSATNQVGRDSIEP